MKTYYQLAKYWQRLPPENILLWQIAQVLGIPASSKSGDVHTPARAAQAVSDPLNRDAQTEAGISELQRAGFPVFQGPLDPTVSAMLSDLPLE